MLFERMGVPFHGEFTSADASGLSESASRITLYGAGSTTSLTLGDDDQVVITDIDILAGAALTVTLYDGANNTVDAGEKIHGPANYGANGGVSVHLQTPHFCQKNTSSPKGYPKVKTSGAGQIDVTIRGVIRRIGS